MALSESARIFFTRQVECNFRVFFPMLYNYDQSIAGNVSGSLLIVHAGRGDRVSRGNMIRLSEPMQKLSQCPDGFFISMFSRVGEPMIRNGGPAMMLPVHP